MKLVVVSHKQGWSGAASPRGYVTDGGVPYHMQAILNLLDRIFSFCVLEHIPTLPDVLKELYRITKPGGEMHVSVDSLGTIDDEELLAKHKADHKVHQYFTADSIKQKVEAAGFEVQEVRPILTGETARAEFSRRITKGYKPQFLRHIKAYKSFVEEEKTPGEKGIMLVVRASKPD